MALLEPAGAEAPGVPTSTARPFGRTIAFLGEIGFAAPDDLRNRTALVEAFVTQFLLGGYAPPLAFSYADLSLFHRVYRALCGAAITRSVAVHPTLEATLRLFEDGDYLTFLPDGTIRNDGPANHSLRAVHDAEQDMVQARRHLEEAQARLVAARDARALDVAATRLVPRGRGGRRQGGR